MKRTVQRLYKRRGRRQDYEKYLREYQKEFKKTAQDHVRTNVRELTETNPSKAAAILKRLGRAPGDCGDEAGFTILSHQEENLTPSECTERILKFFTDISKEFCALDISSLPVRVKVKLLERSQEEKPIIQDYQVYNAIKAAKKPRSAGVPGDLPRKLIMEFPVELAAPVASIFRSIMTTNKWPDKWSIEHGLALKKVKVPATESDLRIISLTSFWSKCMESFVLDWLYKEIGHKIDFTQYGGLKGNSTSHYLIDLVNFVLYNQDLNNPLATLAVLYDFEKAFNRQDHNTLITLLSDMGTPGWLLKLVIAFLEDRKIILNHNGCTTNEESLLGGGPQGTKLGLFLFLILINNAGFKPEQMCRNIGEEMTKPRRKSVPRTQQ